MLNFIKNLNKGVKIAIVCVVVFIILICCANNAEKKKEEERIARELAEAEEREKNKNTGEELSREEQMQISYSEEFGEAPEGFEWDRRGNLVAVGNNEITAEETSYYFLRGLSVLDFSTSAKYSSNSVVIDTYNDFYDVRSSQNYYNQFLRKMYKESLLSLEILEVKDSAVFADGSRIITFSVNILDLTDKDFWKKDKDTIYNDLWGYYNSESDDIKAEQYLYDYILSYYESEEAKKRTITIDLRLEKQKDTGWLVIDDADLNMACYYEDGTSVMEYILETYTDWATDKARNDARAERDANRAKNSSESEELTLEDLETE